MRWALCGWPGWLGCVRRLLGRSLRHGCRVMRQHPAPAALGVLLLLTAPGAPQLAAPPLATRCAQAAASLRCVSVMSMSSLITAFCLHPTVAMWVQAGSGMLPSEAGGLQPGQDTQRVPQPLPPRLADAAESDGLRGAGGAAAEAFDDLLADMQAQAAEGVDSLPRWLGTRAVRSRPGTSACALQQ